MTVDSGQQPTASGTKYSKHDMSGIAATDMNNAHNLSQSDLGGFSKKPVSTVPKTQIQLNDTMSSNNAVARQKRIGKQMTTTTPRDSTNASNYLQLDKQFELTIHQVKMQISSRIDLQVFCQCNDSESAVS